MLLVLRIIYRKLPVRFVDLKDHEREAPKNKTGVVVALVKFNLQGLTAIMPEVQLLGIFKNQVLEHTQAFGRVEVALERLEEVGKVFLQLILGLGLVADVYHIVGGLTAHLGRLYV